jgi:hypothetical protein
MPSAKLCAPEFEGVSLSHDNAYQTTRGLQQFFFFPSAIPV